MLFGWINSKGSSGVPSPVLSGNCDMQDGWDSTGRDRTRRLPNAGATDLCCVAGCSQNRHSHRGVDWVKTVILAHFMLQRGRPARTDRTGAVLQLAHSHGPAAVSLLSLTSIMVESSCEVFTPTTLLAAD